jgi:hyperosmotically inducible periplasmic protein
MRQPRSTLANRQAGQGTNQSLRRDLMNRNICSTALTLAIALSLGVALPVWAGSTGQERSVGTAIDDATITASVKTALLDDERTEGFDINVDTKSGRVTLRGGADSLADRAAASDIALRVKGVISVDNQILVASDGSELREDANKATASGEVREALDETGDKIDDSWITAKVKSQLLADDDVKGLDINVDTKGNIVHLTGVVPTTQARNEAIAIARATKGVRDVKAGALVVRSVTQR